MSWFASFFFGKSKETLKVMKAERERKIDELQKEVSKLKEEVAEIDHLLAEQDD